MGSGINSIKFKKNFFSTLGFYLTILLIMLLPNILTTNFNFSKTIATGLAFLVVIFLRVFYERAVLYEVPLKRIALFRILLFSVINSSLILLISLNLQPVLKEFSFVVSMLISSLITNKFKSIIFPSPPAAMVNNQTNELTNMFNRLQLGRYLFFLLFVPIIMLAYGVLRLDFLSVIAVAYFIAMIAEEIFTLLLVYRGQVTVKLSAYLVVGAILFAVLLCSLFLICNRAGLDNKLTLALTVIILKVAQPLVLGLMTNKDSECNVCN